MSTPETLPTVENVEPPRSFLERFIGIFIAPGETYADIARKPDFIPALVVGVVMSIVITETMLAKIGMERIVRASLEHSSRAASMSPEQIDQAVSQGAKFGAIIAHVFAVIGVPIFLVIIAALGLLLVNAIFGGQMGFVKSLAVACYANLTSVIGGLMAIALILFGDPEHFNPQSPVPSNVGFFLSPDTSKPMMVLANSLDIFVLWFMILLGIGYSEASGRKVKALTIFLCFLGLRIAFLAVQLGLSFLG